MNTYTDPERPDCSRCPEPASALVDGKPYCSSCALVVSSQRFESALRLLMRGAA